ncbi:hypothetical protein [Gracilimonas tropica]|uniref:hypothetical protein n=1 Tax=Gracilimonas tropica TaxID=454600 RepID=UPI000376461B|nr:hypothetical protein [Gracilimonas tropica]
MTYPFIKPKYYLSLLGDLFSFIKRPDSDPLAVKSVKNKTYDTIGLFIIKICFSIAVASLLQFVYEPKNLTAVSMLERFSPIMLLLVAGIILPVYEEITFRLSLKFKPIYFALTSGAFTYYILTKAVFRTRLSLVDETFGIRVFFAIILMLIAYVFIRREKIKIYFERFWHHNFRFIYYFSCISFAWLHLFNFELNLANLLLLPIITLPQLFSATIAGYTRIEFGFRYPLFVHMATNILFTLLSFIPLD